MPQWLLNQVAGGFGWWGFRPQKTTPLGIFGDFLATASVVKSASLGDSCATTALHHFRAQRGEELCFAFLHVFFGCLAFSLTKRSKLFFWIICLLTFLGVS